MQGFFSGINNVREWCNNHWGRAEVIIIIPEGCLFHWRISGNVCLCCLDNGLWSLEFVMYPQSMQFECWNFVARCLTNVHLCTGVLLEWYTCKQLKFSKTPSHQTPTNKLHTLWAYINSRNHRPLPKHLRHTLMWILQWNKQCSGMAIITLVIIMSFLWVAYPTEESLLCVSYLYIIVEAPPRMCMKNRARGGMSRG